MTAKETFAAALKERKGIDVRTGRNDPPAPAPPAPSSGAPGPNGKRRRRARYSASQHALVRLEAQLRAANRRAEKAETALAALRAKIVVAWNRNREKNREITRLRAAANHSAAKAEAALAARDRVQAVNEKVWRLQQEIARLQAAAKERLRPQREKAAAYLTKIRNLWRRIDALEAENEQLRNHTKGKST
jgi:DNA repair exonuclease SbcCD ATPase subunit